MSQFPPYLRAMTTHFPYAWAMAKGYKPEEYRTRNTSFRGYFFIHAGASKDSDCEIDFYGIPHDEIVRKAILGLGKIVAVSGEKGDYAYEIGDRIYFPDPVLDVPGMQSVFWAASDDRRRKAFATAWEQACDIRPSLLETKW